jgi:carboxylesterase
MAHRLQWAGAAMKTRNRKAAAMIILTIVGISLLTVMGGDLAYARVMERRHAAWEKTVERSEDGVRKGGEAFSVGEGRTAILMVHGFGSSPAVFSRMAPALAARGYACRAMRLPGYGESVDAFARATRQDWEDALRRELRSLRADHETVWVVAHSLGGTLALKVLREDPDLADGLVLMAPLLQVSSRRSLGVSPETLFRAGNRLLVFSRMFEICFPVDASDPEVAAIEGRDVFVPRETYLEMFRLMSEVRKAGTKVECPVLAILSRKDRVVDYRAAESFCSRAAPSAKIVYADSAGHVLPLDHGWAEAVRDIDDYIFAHER